MKQAGLDPEIHFFEGQGHTFQGEACEQQYDLLVDFFKRVLE